MTFTIDDARLEYELRNIFTLFFPHEKIGRTDPADGEDGFRLSSKVGDGGFSVTLVGYARGRRYENSASAPDTEAAERLLCRMLYECLADATGKTFRWGILTGIRPVKLLEKLRSRGLSDGEIRRVLHEEYLVAEDKLDLLFETAVHETRIARESTTDSYCLYVAIPFCKTRCSYCSFVSHSIDRAAKLIPVYLDRLCEELVAIAQLAAECGLTLRTVYIGGGTPTVLAAADLRRLIDTIAKCFPVDTALEYTCEAGRPDTIDEEKLRILKNGGVTRISINPQSFNDEVLAAIGRSHTAKELLDCYALAEMVGFSCVNMDLIAGLPMDTPDSFRHSVDKAVALRPGNITVHTLTEKRASTITAEGGGVYRMTDNEVEKALDYANAAIKYAGYFPYYMYRQKNTRAALENVGYCLPGKEGKYNVFIMNETHTILAAGAGAVTKLRDQATGRIERIFNFKYPYEYIDRYEEVLARKKTVRNFYKDCSKL